MASALLHWTPIKSRPQNVRELKHDIGEPISRSSIVKQGHWSVTKRAISNNDVDRGGYYLTFSAASADKF